MDWPMVFELTLVVLTTCQSSASSFVSQQPLLTTPNEAVFVPPDIKYWAYGKVNTTVIDGSGLPWYCYTYRKTYCRPLFDPPSNWRTTRRPYVPTKPPAIVITPNLSPVNASITRIANRNRPSPITISTTSQTSGRGGSTKKPDFVPKVKTTPRPTSRPSPVAKSENNAKIEPREGIEHSYENDGEGLDNSPKDVTTNGNGDHYFAPHPTSTGATTERHVFGTGSAGTKHPPHSTPFGRPTSSTQRTTYGDPVTAVAGEGGIEPGPFTIAPGQAGTVVTPSRPFVVSTNVGPATPFAPATSGSTSAVTRRPNKSVDRTNRDRAISLEPAVFYRRNVTRIDGTIETQATLTLNYSLNVTPLPSAPAETTTAKEVELAPSFTVFGEPCRDACKNRGYPYSWCNKRRLSAIGTWSDSGHCTVASNITSTGDACTDECLRRGQRYFWCHKETTLWGFCTPQFLIERTGRFGDAPNDTRVAPPMAYTARGEACSDSCESRGYSYTWCHKAVPSSRGRWKTSDYCSTMSNATSGGQTCVDECAFRGYSFAWCNTNTTWDYCTPQSFLLFLSRLHGWADSDDSLDTTVEPHRLLLVGNSSRSATTTTTTSTASSPISYTASNAYSSPSVSLDSVLSADYADDENLNEEIKVASDLNSDLFPALYRKAVAFTVFGESCYDECEKRDGFGYTWCHKFEDSSVGTWSDTDYCTSDSSVTPYGEECQDECAKRGQEYFWCHKVTTLWGYCTPDHLIRQLRQNKLERELLILSLS